MRYWLPLKATTIVTPSQPHPENEGQWSVNDVWSGIFGNLTGDWLQIPINAVLATIWGKNNSNMLSAPSWKWASMEHQRFLVWHLGQSKCCFVAIIHILSNGSLFNWQSTWHICYPIMKMSVNWASTMFGVAYSVIMALHGYMCL